MMHGRTVLLILATAALSALGQLLLKSGAQQLVELNRFDFLLAAARNARVLTGLTAWIASTVCWLLVLRVAPLSRVYGLTSLTYVIVPLASIHVFGEQLRRVHAVGIALVITGIATLLSAE